ncbi:MAG: cell division protein ZapA [Bacteroidia bacterium]|nr:cell division protein ZapA [Bacteroidia bacterium]
MDKKSININIFGRQYPARVDSEEAAVIEESARLINARIKAFRAEYKTQDDLDIAIMTCLDIMTEYLTHKANSQQSTAALLNELSILEQKLDFSLQLSGDK